MNIYHMKTRPARIERVSQFLEEGFVSIGFPEIGDLTQKNREAIRQMVIDTYQYSGHLLGNIVGKLNAFKNSVKTGDIVLISENDWVHAGKFGEYAYRKEFITDGLCHRRPVEWFGEVEKDELNSHVKLLLSNRGIITKFKHPYETAELDAALSGIASPEEQKSLDENLVKKVARVLSEALDSENIALRVKAAAGLLDYLK